MSSRECEVVRVDLGERSYDVLIGAELLAGAAGEIAARLGESTKAFIITDDNVGPRHLATLAEPLAAADRLRGSLSLPAGEATKSFDQLQAVTAQLLEAGVERGDCVIALGGGVIGDLAGFAAAILRRGVRYVQVPTSLLAQVDSSVGGKTGINTAHGKNLIGAFHQPHLVLADMDVLQTLPEREMRAGYAEVVKYGLLGDRAFYAWLDDNVDRVLAHDARALRYAVKCSVQMKADIVARDETEQGERALLNLGHTFGHALEAWTGYSARLLHGEGVAVGMCLAFRLSEQLGHCPPQTAAMVSAHIKRAGLPVAIADIDAGEPADAEHLVHLMGQDKKVRDGQMAFILARNIGDAFITRDISRQQALTFLSGEIS